PSPEGHGNPSVSLLCHSDGALTTEESHFLFPLSLRSNVVATAISLCLSSYILLQVVRKHIFDYTSYVWLKI
ncbi:MAG: hypothetical protein J7K15_13540, partial [Deltaproteobacteria bacterium]|nr:hypothetical protein [Deltaproteobacteria bacterium]